ncbi:hypothetical protein [Flammeovirga sp. SubArs3]|uniref:hypothetical protein n=1 Tax=Flammeovirga sp. SubArs3 TaxID=2995316 RepID=UPI00248A9F95|nr:hypothetical protein [Flammeovirga sp. SubArs3]
MRLLFLFFLSFITACNINQKSSRTSQSINPWGFSSEKNTILMHNKKCKVSLNALPKSHELEYTIEYKGKGIIEPILLSTIESRPSAYITEKSISIEMDTLITGTIKPDNHVFKYAQIGERGPLRQHYLINYYENGRIQHLRFHLSDITYQSYLKEYPYQSQKKSYQLSTQSLGFKNEVESYINAILQKKKNTQNLKEIFLSENEINVAGLIGHFKSVFDGQNLYLEVTWINHTELDLWLKKPSNYLDLDTNPTKCNWTTFEDKTAFGKGKRITLHSNIILTKAPEKISIPVDNVLFYDGQLFFPKGIVIEMNQRSMM